MIEATILQSQTLVGRMVATGILSGTIVAPTTIPRPDYEGPYLVTPKITSQMLETQNKTMTDDVGIESIPYYEVSNPQGGSTIIIGGND